jgi:SAM-dependent methyltransferase
LAASGFIEVCSDTIVSGWAWDRDDPGRRLEVEILFDGKPLAKITADQRREDLRTAGIGDGGHGFYYIPAVRIAKKQQRVTAFVVGTQVELPHLSLAEPGPPLMNQLGPIAPEPMRQRVAGTPDEQWWDQSGALTVGEWIQLLGCLDRRIGEFETIVDWGCGCGRALRHLATQLTTKQQLIGIDVDAAAIGWVKANYPQVTVFAIAGAPPTPLADNTADLIVSQSIFTHLPEDIADVWLTELERILKPGGLLITTFHGATAINHPGNKSFVTREFLDVMENYGFYYFKSGEESAFPEYYGSAFHSIDYIARRWTKSFKLRWWAPGFALSYQDSLVLEKSARVSDRATELHEAFTRSAPGAPAAVGAEALNSGANGAELMQKLEEVQKEFSEFRQRVEKALDVGWSEIQRLKQKKR